jgi:hypothetical protein
MTSEAPSCIPCREQTEYRVLTEAAALRFCEAEELTWVAAEIRLAYRRGYVCVAALKDGHLAAWVWLNFNSMPPPLNGHAFGPVLERAVATPLDGAELRS